jgi:predicted deacetylase
VPPERRTLAVALHDVEPATYERCAEIRTWLDERGVNRVTLLAIPARDLHPVGERSPELVRWLASRREQGDAIAQHGFQHEQLRSPRWARRIAAPTRARRAAEFAGLDDEETRRAVEAGWRIMKLAGIEPDGFVAPAYAYTPALHRALGERFRWWASLLGVHSREPLGPEGRGARIPRGNHTPLARRGRGPAASAPHATRRATLAWGPRTVHAGALLAGETLRVDLSPAVLRPGQLRRLERTLAHAVRDRTAVTYDELASAPLQAENTAASNELMPRVAA